MATKPTPGGSDGTYGTELNAFLDESLASDGKIKDGAVFSTSAAPTVDAGVANKKFVVDTVAAAVPDDDAFGTWDVNPTNFATGITALSDGTVIARRTSGGVAIDLQGFTPTATLRVRTKFNAPSTSDVFSITFPVKKGDTWKVTGATTASWLPIGG